MQLNANDIHLQELSVCAACPEYVDTDQKQSTEQETNKNEIDADEQWKDNVNPDFALPFKVVTPTGYEDLINNENMSSDENRDFEEGEESKRNVRCASSPPADIQRMIDEVSGWLIDLDDHKGSDGRTQDTTQHNIDNETRPVNTENDKASEVSHVVEMLNNVD